MVGSEKLSQPQVPVTLPTYDEIIGQNGITNENYNDHILSLIQPERLNVLTIHAEVEGIVCRDLFEDFLQKAKERKIEIVPLGSLLDDSLPAGRMIRQELPGREGWVACQATADSSVLLW
jgi:undecaprenyl phosphate-alpha-L-ara4FN deformylase